MDIRVGDANVSGFEFLLERGLSRERAGDHLEVPVHVSFRTRQFPYTSNELVHASNSISEYLPQLKERWVRRYPPTEFEED